MKKQVNVNPCICVTAKKFDVLDWALKTWSNSIVFTIWGLFLVIVVFITIRVFLLLFLIIGVVCLGCLGCLVYVWGVRDILNARAIYLQIEEAWA